MRKNIPGFLSVALLVLAQILMPESSALAIENDPNLVSYWQLDGDANDTAGGNHGTLIGDPAWVDDPNRGWCLSFDGDGDYIDAGDDPSLTFTEAITVACWIKVRAFDRNWNAIINKGDDWVLARTRDDNRVAFLCLGLTGGGWPEVYSDDVNDENWHHIAGVYDGSMLYMYQDGNDVDSKSVHGSINSKWSKVLMGENGQAANRYWNGLIDDVRIYNRPLTAEEIGDIVRPKPPAPPPPPPAPNDVNAVGHDSRIDLRWQFDTDPNLEGYNIYRADSNEGPFTKLNDSAHTVSVYSDFFGENDQTYYYHVKSAAILGGGESGPSNIVSATSYAMTDEQLLTSVQEAVFRYFWDYGHPVSGLAREGYKLGHSTDTCTSGGTGMSLMTICVGAEREFVTRAQAAGRVLQILNFLDEDATRFHGAWSHWINGATGETKPFGEYDNGGDLVETAYMVQGMLTVRQYFDDPNDPVETEIRSRATGMWEQVEWDWYLQHPDSQVLYWHFSPDYEWHMNHAVRGYNECMITYLLAIASPTHPIPASCYYNGWAGSPGYANGNTYYDYTQPVGPEKGGPLFFTHYSHLGFDPRNKSDKYCNYFDNSRNISLINRAYCIENPRGHTGYSDLVWGLTASFNPWGYSAHSPTSDNGTIAPTAALSAMPYVPDESIATLKEFYYTFGEDLWGPFGFFDAFNLSQNWFAPGYVAIDQGPIVVMIENYRTQLCWNLFMANPEIQPMLDAIGWTSP
ncbi:MAG: glucoamylase family protein [Sedimentisphaerales bacterium]